MSNKLYEESSISAIASAIRAKLGTQDTYKVGQMAAAVASIPTGGSSDLDFRDKLIIPDIYNVGSHGYLEPFDELSDTSGLIWNTSSGNLKLDFNTSSKKTIYNVDTSAPIVYRNIDFTAYTGLEIANVNLCSKNDQYYKAGIQIVFINCLFRKVNSAYSFASADMIQFAFMNCSMEMFKLSNSYVERCLIGNRTFYKTKYGDTDVEDAIKLFSYDTIINSYVMDVEPEVSTAGEAHYDGLQFSSDVDSTILYNVRFECMNMPYSPKGGGWSYSVFYQAAANDSYMNYCIFHGGGLYGTSIKKNSTLLLEGNLIGAGYSTPCYPGDTVYQLTDEGLDTYDTLLVSSIFCDGKDITIICSNDYTSAKTLTVRQYAIDGLSYTTKTFNIPACPSVNDGWTGISKWSDLPFDIPCVIHDVYNVGKIECYDGNTKIRTWFYEEGVPIPDTLAVKTITENGTYDMKSYASAYVNVPTSVSGTIQITQNGTGIDVSQYASADVAVPGIVPTGTYPITDNGTYDITNYANVSVNVSGGGGGLPSNITMTTVNISSDVISFDVSYDKTKTVEMVLAVPLALQGDKYEQTFLMGKMNFINGNFEQIYGTVINYNATSETGNTNANAGAFTFDSTNGLITLTTKSSSYTFKAGDTYAVFIVYAVT